MSMSNFSSLISYFFSLLFFVRLYFFESLSRVG